MRIPASLLLVVTFWAGTSAPPARTPAPGQTGNPEYQLLLVERPAPVPEPYESGFASISAADSLALLSYLASDLLEGRETGSRGYRLAADYAASLFALWHIRPGGDRIGGERRFQQRIAMRDLQDLGCSIDLQIRQGGTREHRTFQEARDFENYYLNRIPETRVAPVVFAGYGISDPALGYDDFEKLEVAGKIVLILDGMPEPGGPASPFGKREWQDKYGGSNGFLDRIKRAGRVAERGAAAVLVARQSLADGDVYADREPPAIDDSRPIIQEPSRLVVLPGARRGNGSIHISRDMADAVLSASGQSIESLQRRIAASGRPASFEIRDTQLTVTTTAKTDNLLRCYNVIGSIEGSDPALKNEMVMIGAHLDHLGRRGEYIYNGADDNASGAAAVLQIARAVAVNPMRPKRTIVFCLWTGEEFNRLGSRYYLEHPEFPLAQTLAYINLDMIGRPYSDAMLAAPRARRLKLTAGQKERIKPANFINVGFSAGNGFEDVLGQADRSAGLDLLLQPEKEARVSGIVSDDLSFFEAHVPYIYWAGPIHEDYHQTSDSADKVNGEWLAKITRLAYLTAVSVADR